VCCLQIFPRRTNLAVQSLVDGYSHIVRIVNKNLLTCRCREIMRNSPTALRVLKAALNAAEDGQAGIQVLHLLPPQCVHALRVCDWVQNVQESCCAVHWLSCNGVL
jgi:hypothetical protein